MSHDEVVTIAVSAASRAGLIVDSRIDDDTLFLTLHPVAGASTDRRRHEVRIWTAGTGAFLLDFDSDFSYQEFAYDAPSQE